MSMKFPVSAPSIHAVADSPALAGRIRVAALTDVGKVRANNEDTFGIDTQNDVYVVCDGMGGAAAGEVASDMAKNIFLKTFSGGLEHTDVFALSEFEDKLSLAIKAANAAVYREGRTDLHHNMGTTLVAAALSGTTLLIANVGDSRAYVLQADPYDQRAWRQVTEDHSYVNELIRMGTIDAEDRHSPELQRFASTITRAIGAAEDVAADFFPLEMAEGDMVLLASDGLTRYLDSEEFDRMVDAADLEGSCQRLVDEAKAAGGVDNITCILLRYDGEANATLAA